MSPTSYQLLYPALLGLQISEEIQDMPAAAQNNFSRSSNPLTVSRIIYKYGKISREGLQNPARCAYLTDSI
jgi:hypothetical protein